MFERMVREQEAAAAAAASVISQTPTNDPTSRSFSNQENYILDAQKNQWIPSKIYPSQPTSINNINNEPINLNVNKINITDSHLKDLKQAIQYFMPIAKIDSTDSAKLNASKTRSPSPMRSISPCESLLSKAKYEDLGIVKQTEKANSISNTNDLPTNWIVKKNHKGITYYFNIKTKQSQWHLPVLSSSTAASNSSDDHKNIPQPSSPSPASNDDANKKFKEQFREKLSKLVIKLLQPYLRPECKKGHIEKTDDFKYLARKFTHCIMEKEMTRVKNFQELEMNGKVKSKAEEYIKKYMYRFEGNYSRKNDDLD
jgi:hypothetical protein